MAKHDLNGNQSNNLNANVEDNESKRILDYLIQAAKSPFDLFLESHKYFRRFYYLLWTIFFLSIPVMFVRWMYVDQVVEPRIQQQTKEDSQHFFDVEHLNDIRQDSTFSFKGQTYTTKLININVGELVAIGPDGQEKTFTIKELKYASNFKLAD